MTERHDKTKVNLASKESHSFLLRRLPVTSNGFDEIKNNVKKNTFYSFEEFDEEICRLTVLQNRDVFKGWSFTCYVYTRKK